MSHCQKCDSELPYGARFCGKCGFAQLSVDSSAIVPVQDSQVAVANAIKPEDVVKIVPDTPPISPAISLIPTRSVHPGLKQAALPGGAGSASLHPPDSEPAQKNAVEAEVPITLGQREPARDMIPETPKPSTNTSQFGPSSLPETPESASSGSSGPEPAKRPEAIGQLIRPITPLASQTETSQSSEQRVDEKSPAQAQFSMPGAVDHTILPSPPVSSASVQFKSRVWPAATDANRQSTVNEQSPTRPASMPDPASEPGLQPPLVGKSSSLIRPVGFSPSTLRPSMPTTPAQPGQSTSLQSGLAPEKPGSTPAYPTIVSPVVPSSPSLQQNVAPAQNSQFTFSQREQQVENRINQPSWQRPNIQNRPLRQNDGIVGNPQPDPSDIFGLSESDMQKLNVTSKAAEHWRQSWRDRQRAEAGPAEGVSRGHASVPMPLMAMQQSLARIRAVILANKEQNDQPRNFGFWITIILIFCLIGGLGAYIISSYVSGSPLGSARVVPPAGAAQPSLTAQNPTIVVGQALHIHGQHFSTNDSIHFLLDTTQPIVDTSGKNISVQTNGQGAFDATIPVGSDWITGNHVIQANDSHSNQFAYLTINVLPSGTPVASSPDLALQLNGQPLHQLLFNAVVGRDNPSQRITLYNTSGAPLKWSAIAATSNNLNWLVINDNHTFGTLNISGTDSIGVSALITGLKSSTQPYKGQIIFTINDKEQLTLPVQLTVSDAPSELVFSPDPIIATYVPGGTCQSGAELTLINLGEQVISWKLGIDGNTSSHLKFLNSQNVSIIQGQLAPANQSTSQFSSTQVLTLGCSGVHPGDSYTITLYANNNSWTEQIFIQS